MSVFARGTKHVAVQRPHDADASHHRRAVLFGDQDQEFHRCLPFGGGVLGRRKLGEVSNMIRSRVQRGQRASNLAMSSSVHGGTRAIS